MVGLSLLIYKEHILLACYTRITILWIRSLYVEVVRVGLTDAGGDGRAALLVALGAAVTGDPGHSVLAGALTCCLVARLPRCSDRMAIACCGGRREKI